MTLAIRMLILGILFLLYFVKPILGWTAVSGVALYVGGTVGRRWPR